MTDNDLKEWLADHNFEQLVPQKGNFSSPMHEAFKTGNLDIAKRLFANGHAIDAKDIDLCTPMMKAAEFGHLEVAKWAYETFPESVEISNFSGDFPMTMAVYRGQLEMARWLYEKTRSRKSLEEYMTPEGLTLTLTAADAGHLDCLKWLVSEHCPIDSVDLDGCNALFLASQSGHVDVVRYLLEVGFRNLSESLAVAIQGEYLEVCKILVEYGANLKDTITREFHLVVSALCTSSDLDFVRWLLPLLDLHDASIGEEFYALKVEVLELMLQKGLSIENQFPIYWPEMCMSGNLGLLQWLFENGYRPHLDRYGLQCDEDDEAQFEKSHTNEFALKAFALSCGHLDLVEFLEKESPSPVFCGDDGVPPWLLFAFWRSFSQRSESGLNWLFERVWHPTNLSTALNKLEINVPHFFSGGAQMLAWLQLHGWNMKKTLGVDLASTAHFWPVNSTHDLCATFKFFSKLFGWTRSDLEYSIADSSPRIPPLLWAAVIGSKECFDWILQMGVTYESIVEGGKDGRAEAARLLYSNAALRRNWSFVYWLREIHDVPLVNLVSPVVDYDPDDLAWQEAGGDMEELVQSELAPSFIFECAAAQDNVQAMLWLLKQYRHSAECEGVSDREAMEDSVRVSLAKHIARLQLVEVRLFCNALQWGATKCLESLTKVFDIEWERKLPVVSMEPMLVAAMLGNVSSLDWLYAHGAPLNTPLYASRLLLVASRNLFPTSLKWLKKHGVNIGVSTRQHHSLNLLEQAVIGNSLLCFKYLLKQGWSIYSSCDVTPQGQPQTVIDFALQKAPDIAMWASENGFLNR